MKKVKMFSILLGIMLSVAGVFAKTTPDTNMGSKISDCPNPQAVDNDCQSGHSGATCQIDFVDVAVPDGTCNLILKRTN